MKLILCPHCQDVRKLDAELTICRCGKSCGKYLNDLDAVYGGSAIPLGFENSSLVSAIRHQPKQGMGERFTAFVIPKECPTYEKAQNLF